MLYICITVINQFLEREGRRPEAKTCMEDAEILATLKTEVLDQSGVTPDILEDGFTK